MIVGLGYIIGSMVLKVELNFGFIGAISYILEVTTVIFIIYVIFSLKEKYKILKVVLYGIYPIILFILYDYTYNIDALHEAKIGIFKSTAVNPNFFGLEVINYFSFLNLLPFAIEKLDYSFQFIFCIFFIVGIKELMTDYRWFKKIIFVNEKFLFHHLIYTGILLGIIGIFIDINDAKKSFRDEYLSTKEINKKIVDKFFNKILFSDDIYFYFTSSEKVIVATFNNEEDKYIFEIRKDISEVYTK